jgi:hypothetical protein
MIWSDHYYFKQLIAIAIAITLCSVLLHVLYCTVLKRTALNRQQLTIVLTGTGRAGQVRSGQQWYNAIVSQVRSPLSISLSTCECHFLRQPQSDIAKISTIDQSMIVIIVNRENFEADQYHDWSQHLLLKSIRNGNRRASQPASQP